MVTILGHSKGPSVGCSLYFSSANTQLRMQLHLCVCEFYIHRFCIWGVNQPWIKNTQKNGNFPGRPVIKILSSYCRSHGFDLRLQNKIPQAARWPKKEKKFPESSKSKTWICQAAANLSQISLVAQLVKNPPSMQETPIWFLGLEVPLEEGMVTHSSILAWRMPMDRGA